MPVSGDHQVVLDDYFRRWAEWLGRVSQEGRLGKHNPNWKHDMPAPPVEAAKWGALHHPNPRARRECLSILDHHANDESVDVFRAALADPVPRVRLIALHGLSCERCRTTELCVADVAPDLVRALESDPTAKVRHGAVQVMVRLAGRDRRVGDALARAAHTDADPLVRQVAQAAIDGRQRDVRTRKAIRRRANRARSAAT